MFEFENGNLIKGAYVKIDGVEYKVTMPQYSGKTPMSAENLNKAQRELKQETKKELQTQINSLASGSPLVASTIEEMTDTNKVYVNTADGHWYYYNGTQWMDGGVYQSSGIDENSITLDKINFNKYCFNDFEVINKKLLGYDTTTFLPKYSEESDEYYTALIDIFDGMPDIYFPVSEISGQILIIYTEGEKAGNRTYSDILDNKAYYLDYDSTTGLCRIMMDTIYTAGYRKVAIQMTPSNNAIELKNVDGNNINIELKKFISGKNLKDKTISKSNLDFDILDATDNFNYIRSDRLENKYSRGYNTETLLPVFIESESAKTIIIPIKSTGKIRISKNSLFTSEQSQLYFLKSDGTMFSNYTNQTIMSYTSFPYTIKSALNKDLITIYENYIEIICDHVYREGKATSVLVTFDSSMIDVSYINFINSYYPDWLSTPKAITDESYKDVEIVLPSKMRVIKGVEANIYYQNIVRYFNTNFLHRVATDKMISPYKKYLRMNADKESVYSTDMNIEFYLKDSKNPTLSDSIYVEAVAQNSGEGITKKVLFIGDSMTKAGVYSQEVLNLFSNDVMNIELLGTQGSGLNQHEGRNGWRAYNYAYCKNGSDDSAATLSETNPFYNPTTKQFDFNYYMTNQNYSDVDYVFLNIGTNDWSRGNYNTHEDLLEFYNLMINSIKEYNNNIKIGLWLPPTKGLMDTDDKKAIDLALRSQEFAIKYYDNREDENIFLIPVYFNVDPENDYQFTNQPISNRNSDITQKVCSDRTHPSKNGYYKMADVIYTYIKYFGSLDE